MRKIALGALAGLLAMTATSVADGIDLPMAWTDSLTIEGTRYTCNGPARGGVVLSPGDKLSAGMFRLRCAKRGDVGGSGGDPPPPSSTIAITSAVDTSCLSQLNTSISGRVPQKDVPLWTDACRNPPIGRACSIVSSKPDNSCFTAVDGLISGSFSSDIVADIQRACHRIEASCPARGGRKVTSNVDMNCVTQLYTSTSGKPNATTIAGWVDGCRSQNTARCTLVSATFNASCYSTAYQYMSGRPNVTEAATIARACSTLELACD